MTHEATQFNINGTLVELSDPTARESAANKYTLPVSGIPMEDLSDEVKSKLNPTIPSSAVTSMAGYEIAVSGTSIVINDTLNTAIGKLEKMVAELQQVITDNQTVTEAALDDLYSRLDD